VLAPGAAALFGATVTWAAATTPTSTPVASQAGAPGSATSAASAGPAHHTGLSPQARHWRVVAEQRTQTRHELTRRLGAVQARVVRLHAADKRLASTLAKAAAAAAAAASAGGSAPAPLVNQPVGPAPVVAPAPAYVPPAPIAVPAAPPPPVHAATGGSGHP
jgi:hypothetical protein